MRQWTVDAFASAPFMGNPACVIEPFDRWPAVALMQALAQENNQAETAFLLKTADPSRFDLRWFTPAVEVPLCGHATLASAHALFAELGLDAPAVIFDTQSGPLTVSRAGDRYEMDFPADFPSLTASPDGLAQALGVQPVEVWSSRFLTAILTDEAAVRDLRPSVSQLIRIAGPATIGPGLVVVAALASPGRPYDVVSRFFCPGIGIDEDPATGAAHCILSPLFSAKLGRARLRFHQAYPGRGGDLDAEHRGPRVVLTGRAVTVVESLLRVDL